MRGGGEGEREGMDGGGKGVYRNYDRVTQKY